MQHCFLPTHICLFVNFLISAIQQQIHSKKTWQMSIAIFNSVFLCCLRRGKPQWIASPFCMTHSLPRKVTEIIVHAWISIGMPICPTAFFQGRFPFSWVHVEFLHFSHFPFRLLGIHLSMIVEMGNDLFFSTSAAASNRWWLPHTRSLA